MGEGEGGGDKQYFPLTLSLSRQGRGVFCLFVERAERR
jgi:hypothetical protein